MGHDGAQAEQADISQSASNIIPNYKTYLPASLVDAACRCQRNERGQHMVVTTKS